MVPSLVSTGATTAGGGTRPLAESGGSGTRAPRAWRDGRRAVPRRQHAELLLARGCLTAQAARGPDGRRPLHLASELPGASAHLLWLERLVARERTWPRHHECRRTRQPSLPRLERRVPLLLRRHTVRRTSHLARLTLASRLSPLLVSDFSPHVSLSPLSTWRTWSTWSSHLSPLTSRIV
jgi:hypothetical protein